MMPPPDLIQRLENVHVDAAVGLDELEQLAARQQRRGTWLVALLVILAVAVPVQRFFATPTGQVRIDDPAATAADDPAAAEDDARTTDPNRAWEPGELARITIDAAEAGQLGMPVAVSVRASDGERNRVPHLWVTWAETEPFGPGATIVRGHRTLYGAPLYDLDVVARDDHVRVLLPHGAEKTYVVTETRTLPAGQPPQVVVPDASEQEWLLITTPDPRFTSAADQLVVTARRVE